jgi:glycosyltransferase involved in cell wall biosynthesis
MKKKSILFIGNHFNNQKGFHYIFDELILRLNQKGWRTYKSSKYRIKVFRLIDMLWSILTKVDQYQVAEVDVFSGAAFFWAEQSTKLLHLLGKPIILTLHGGNLPEFSTKNNHRIRLILELATNVVTPSRYLYSQFKEIRPDIRIIPNPVEISQYVYHQRTYPAPHLVWVRAFHEIYNPSLAPYVVNKLKDAWPEIQLTMIGPDKGDGSLGRMIKIAEKFQTRDRIILPGRVPRNEVPDWLNKNDIFINTTNVDNTPVSVIEAMACGLCIVSTNVGGLPFLLDDGLDALLVPPNDPNAMANAIEEILTSPSLANKLSMNARRKAERFSWDEIYPQWENLLLETNGTFLRK